jgi:hypothetical protein
VRREARSSFILISEERDTATKLRTAGGRGGRFPALLRRVLLGAGLVLYTLLFAEGFVRVFDQQPLMPRYISGTAWGVRGNIPYARYWHHTPEVDVQYRINGQGLRADRDYPLRKPAGTCRIGIFGDSFLFGLEVDLRDSFADRLEKRLRERGFPVEVLNFSVGGFGTAEMLQTYERFGRQFDLDTVIFSWDSSDLDDNVRSDLYRLETGKLERAHAEYLPAVDVQDMLMRYRLYRLISDHSELYTFVRERMNLFFKTRVIHVRNESLSAADPGDAEGVPSGDPDVDELQHRNKIDLSAAILIHAHDVVTSSGEDFYLIDIPARLSRTKFSSPLDILPDSVRSHLQIISPLAALSKTARPDLKLYYERGLGHFTPTGVQILVDEAVERVASSPRLASCAEGAHGTAATDESLGHATSSAGAPGSSPSK